MKLLTGKRKLVVVGGGIAATVALGATSAFAYFDGGGAHDSSSATVQSAGQLTVTANTANPTTVNLGQEADYKFKITNPGTSAVAIASLKASIPSSNGYVVNGANTPLSAQVNGQPLYCQTNWFTIGTTSNSDGTGTVAVPALTGLANNELAAGKNVTVTVPVTLNDTADDQTGCSGGPLQVTLSVNGG